MISLVNVADLKFSVDLFRLNEEILNGKLYSVCSEIGMSHLSYNEKRYRLFQWCSLHEIHD